MELDGGAWNEQRRYLVVIAAFYLVAGAGFVQDPTMLELRKAV
jgi:hypothetical protein